VKKAVIEEDEYETGYRRILNYGHTFCHSLESLTNHEVPHGLAVAWGVDVANFVAQKRGLLEPLVYARIHAFIQAHFSVAVQAPYDAKQIVAGMGRDKKAAAGQVSLILLAAPGDLRIVQTSLDTDLENDISEYLAHDDIFSRH
jgi:3-dehydroquinate synthase